MELKLLEIAYYSEGGVPYDVAYALPVWKRNVIYNFLIQFKEQEKEQTDEMMDQAKGKSGSNIEKAKQQFDNIPSKFKKSHRNQNLSRYRHLVQNPPVKP